MQESPGFGLSEDKTASPPFVIGIIFEQRGPTQYGDQVLEGNVFLHHFLVRMGGNPERLGFRLPVEAVGDRDGVSLIHVRHGFGSYHAQPKLLWHG